MTVTALRILIGVVLTLGLLIGSNILSYKIGWHDAVEALDYQAYEAHTRGCQQ